MSGQPQHFPSPPANPVTPIPAASTVVLRDGPDGIEALMVQRHDKMHFAGALVFPGGKLEKGDAHPDLLARVRTGRDMAPDRLALALAAIREAFEETGILMAYRRGSDTYLTKDEVLALETQRVALAKDDLSLVEFAAAEDLEFTPDELVHYAHWIAPLTAKVRFDTLFFLAEAPKGQLARHDGLESVDSIWVRPERALETVEQGKYRLMFPTHMNLIKLVGYATVADAMTAMRRETVQTVMPVFDPHAPGGPVVRIPAGSGYAITEMPSGRYINA